MESNELAVGGRVPTPALWCRRGKTRGRGAAARQGLATLLAAALVTVACAGPGAAAKPASVASSGQSGAPSPPAPGPFTANGEADASSGAVATGMEDTLTFSPNSFVRVKPGQKVAVRLQNTGKALHNVTAPALGAPDPVKVQPGESGTATFTAPAAPGTYAFWCSEPGHAEAGMVGQVVVQ